ncbi:N-acetyltransferase [Streptomyces cinereoruber]|uniref:N-acetyltransferase n=1 Tax=Streptomyces cinereoruber TaxID=67260 RepID=A0AAV4KKP4_9ACTN|nr:GNAT family N-acetyltransferase [Streptomyces cinereoruber]MBB4161933.1 GNAT superfamily N-acetyltransferase [Streptomyces cinereoruber]MBY8817222.1 GNAT family N-acetyltransferase [Streptomyces cinereoruber]NIH64465.1 GNAT superfamily N-acetyltransferase [Streptomyces cinereoruber]QEV32186.1 GNAT family N-acetyltransferase [Streptomyces cinereoruber]GGR27559.1 N-acetyltransferase [Streptomyces cinereoruber]
MIRLATEADLDAVVALHTEARATYYRGHLPDAEFLGPEEVARSRAGWAAAVGRGIVLCAERDGEVAGVAAHRVDDGVPVLSQLHVSPARWRRGIGGELHDACVEIWHAAGAPWARLEVFDKNERARAFYAARGWTPDPETPRNGDHLVLRLTLGPREE